MPPLDLGLGQPRLGVQLPRDSGEPPQVTLVVGGYQLHPEYVQVITGHIAAPSDQSQPHPGAARQWFKRVPNSCARLAHASMTVSPARLPDNHGCYRLRIAGYL